MVKKWISAGLFLLSAKIFKIILYIYIFYCIIYGKLSQLQSYPAKEMPGRGSDHHLYASRIPQGNLV